MDVSEEITDTGGISGEPGPASQAEHQAIAAEAFFTMWSEASARGVAQEELLIVCLSGVVNRLVMRYGEHKAAQIVAGIPDQILKGHFSPRNDAAVS